VESAGAKRTQWWQREEKGAISEMPVSTTVKGLGEAGGISVKEQEGDGGERTPNRTRNSRPPSRKNLKIRV